MGDSETQKESKADNNLNKIDREINMGMEL